MEFGGYKALKIATWNVNSIRARLPRVREWVEAQSPDVLLLQEIKCCDNDFPEEDFKRLGYVCTILGQKSYNGVAILSRHPVSDLLFGLPTYEEDTQARYVEATIAETLRVASIYLPNGNPISTQKFAYKLAWMDALHARARDLLEYEMPILLGGDYNVCPTEHDVYDPEDFASDALCQPESRSKFRALLHLGYTDAFRARYRESRSYTYWDYQAGAWAKDYGLRIDHCLLSPLAADCLGHIEIDRAPRGQEKASDHVPLICSLDV